MSLIKYVKISSHFLLVSPYQNVYIHLKKQKTSTPHTRHERELTFLSFVFSCEGKLPQIVSQFNKCLTGRTYSKTYGQGCVSKMKGTHFKKSTTLNPPHIKEIIF